MDPQLLISGVIFGLSIGSIFFLMAIGLSLVIIAGLVVGLIGLTVAINPGLWVSLFTSDPGVTAAASSYLMLAGPLFAFFGLGACLYFSSQGAAKVGGPVIAGTARLLIVAGGGWWLASAGAPAWTLFALVGLAMVVYGLGTALSIRLTRWGK